MAPATATWLALGLQLCSAAVILQRPLQIPTSTTRLPTFADGTISSWLDSTSDSLPAMSKQANGLPAQLVMFGDSLTQYSFKPGGTGAAMSDAWQRKLDIVNRGYAGWTADMLRYVAPWILTSANPIQILSLWIGTNDMVANRSVADYEANIEELSESFFETRPNTHENLSILHDPILLLLSAPPNLVVPLQRSTDYANAVQRVADKLQRRHPRQVFFVDIHQAIVDKAQLITSPETAWEQLQALMPDGVHLNEAGYEIVSWQILNVVNGQANHLYPGSMPESFPGWFDPSKAHEVFPPLPSQPDCHQPIRRAKPPLKA